MIVPTAWASAGLAYAVTEVCIPPASMAGKVRPLDTFSAFSSTTDIEYSRCGVSATGSLPAKVSIRPSVRSSASCRIRIDAGFQDGSPYIEFRRRSAGQIIGYDDDYSSSRMPRYRNLERMTLSQNGSGEPELVVRSVASYRSLHDVGCTYNDWLVRNRSERECRYRRE